MLVFRASQLPMYTFELSAEAAVKSSNLATPQAAGTEDSATTVRMLPLFEFTTVTCEFALPPFAETLAT
jgi:hypothetical protein